MGDLLHCYHWKFQEPFKPDKEHPVAPSEMHITQTPLAGNPLYYKHSGPVPVRDLAVGTLVGSKKKDDEHCKGLHDWDKKPEHIIGQCLVPLKEGQTELTVAECLQSNVFVETHERASPSDHAAIKVGADEK